MAEKMDTAGGCVSYDEFDDEKYSLYPKGSQVPLDICERVICKSKTVSKMLLCHVQLDPETITSLVARDVITEDNAGLLKNETISHSKRVFETLRPAILQGGQWTLKAFYHTLLCTSEGRLGHKELAEAIKKRVDWYVKPQASDSAPEEHMLTANSERSDKLYGTKHLYLKQSSMPSEMERDNRRKLSPSAGVHRQLSVDGPYGSRPRSQLKVASNTDSDSSSCLSDKDGLPADGSGRRKQQTSAVNLLIALEKDYVQRFKAEQGDVRASFIKELSRKRHLWDTGSTPNPALQLADWLLSAEDSKKVAGCSKPQISDVVDLWIGKKLKGSDLFRMTVALARVQGFGRYITCIVQKTGAYEGDQLLSFRKALGHAWILFAQKIGYEDDELQLEGSSKISKKVFFSRIWRVPKFDNDEMKELFIELLSTTQLENALHNFRNRLSRAASRHGLAGLPPSGATSTVTMASLSSSESTTDTDTPSETDEELQSEHSATVVERTKNSPGTVADSPLDSHSPDLRSPSSTGSDVTGTAALLASSVPPSREESDNSSATLVGDWSSSDETVMVQDLSDEEDYCDDSALMVYDRSAIFFGPDIVPPPISKRSEFAGLYDLLKAQPFDREFFEVVLMSETSLVNRLTKDDRSLLFLACELNNAEAATVLLKYGANPNLQDKYGRACLHLLSVYWNETILWALLQNESTDVNIATFKTQATPLCVACLMKDVAPVKRLLENGADPNGAEETTCVPIVLAAREGAYQVVQELLEKRAVVDKQNSGGYTALHMAAFEDHHAIAELLLSYKSNPNVQATNCATALSCAAANGHIATTQLLLEHGATVNTARKITHDGVMSVSEVSALAEAALGGFADVVTVLLNAGANVHFKSDSYLSVLGYACIGGNADVVRQVMIYGNMKNKPSELALPLQSAMQYENYRCAQVLIEEAGGVEALRKAHRYDSQLLQNLDAISALLSSGGEEMMNMSDKVPKSVGRTDDEFQRYRSRTLNASIEEVKLAELFTPDESMCYEGLVQYIVEKHIVLTAEFMTGEDVLLAEAEANGYNEVADFMRQYRSNMIQPTEFSLRINNTSPPAMSVYCKHVDLVHLQQCARSMDNRIALQYFLEMQRRRDLGHPTGFGLQMARYASAFNPGFSSQGFEGPGHGFDIHTTNISSGLQGGQAFTMGIGNVGFRNRQGLSAPHSSPAVQAKPKGKALGMSASKTTDGWTESAMSSQTRSKPANAPVPTVPVKRESECSNKVSLESSAPVNSTAPSHSQSFPTQSSPYDSDATVVQMASEDEPDLAETPERTVTPPIHVASNNSELVPHSTGRKSARKRIALRAVSPTSEEDANSTAKLPPKGWKLRDDIESNDSEFPDDDSCDLVSLSGASTSALSSTSSSQSRNTGSSATAHGNTAHPGTKHGMVVQSLEKVPQEVGESLSSMETASGDGQGPTPNLPLELPRVSQGVRTDPPSMRMAPTQTMSTKDEVPATKEHSSLLPKFTKPDDELSYDSESLSGTNTSTPISVSTGRSMSTNASVTGHENTAHPGTKPNGMVVQSPETISRAVRDSQSCTELPTGVGQGPTLKLPPESPLVSQGFHADPPSMRMVPTQAMPSEDESPVVQGQSPLLPNIPGKLNMDEPDVLAAEHPPPNVNKPSLDVEDQPSSNDQASLAANIKTQHGSESVEDAAEDVVHDGVHVNIARIPDKMAEMRDAKATEPPSVANSGEQPPNVHEMNPVVCKSVTLLRQSATACLRMPLASPDCSACMLVESIPDVLIDCSCSKHKLLLRKVCPSIKQRWTALGRYLGLQEDALSEIKENYETSEGRGTEVVLKWIKQSGDRTGSENSLRSCTWQQLALCLAYILRNDLVQLIQSRLQAATSTEEEALSSSEISSTNSRHLYILRHIAESLAEDWEDLAKQLRVNKDLVGKCDAYDDSTSLCFAVLMLWLSEQQGRDGTTFDMLFTHLRNMDYDHLVGEAHVIDLELTIKPAIH